MALENRKGSQSLSSEQAVSGIPGPPFNVDGRRHDKGLGAAMRKRSRNADEDSLVGDDLH